MLINVSRALVQDVITRDRPPCFPSLNHHKTTIRRMTPVITLLFTRETSDYQRSLIPNVMTSFSIKNTNKMNQRNSRIMVYVVLRLRSDVSPPSSLVCCHVLVHFVRTAPVKSPEFYGR